MSSEYMSCPYCSYCSHDFVRLQAHVQQAHPEHVDKESHSEKPSETQLNDFEVAQLLAFEEAGLPANLAFSDRHCAPSITDSISRETSTSNSSLPSSVSDDEEPWVQCVCGERVQFHELDAHADMHAQEDLSMDDGAISADIELETTPSRTLRPLNDMLGTFSTNIPSPLRNHDQLHQRNNARSHSPRRRVPTLKEIFLGTPSTPKRKSPYKTTSTKQGKTRRLGVSGHPVATDTLTDEEYSALNWAHLRTRSKCQTGWLKCSGTVLGSPRLIE
jgi:hypothetical protein